LVWVIWEGLGYFQGALLVWNWVEGKRNWALTRVPGILGIGLIYCQVCQAKFGEVELGYGRVIYHTGFGGLVLY